MSAQDSKLVLFDSLLSHKGIQNLMDVASGLMGNPLFLADMSARLVCMSSSCSSILDGFGNSACPWENDANARDAIAQGYLDWIYHHDKPILGQVTNISGSCLAARVRDGGDVLGHITVVDRERPFADDDYELLPLICQVVAFELRRKREPDPRTIPYGPLMLDLLQGRAKDASRIRSQFRLVGSSLPDSMRLLVLRSPKPEHFALATYLRMQLLEAFPCSLGIILGDECVHVVDGALSKAKVAELLASRVYLGGFVVGASWEFEDPSDMHNAYLQADAAVRLSGVREGQASFYDSVVCQHLMERASVGDMARESFVLPGILKLVHSDAEEGAARVHDLATYLNCGRNVSKAARLLHVHKNSLYYRLQRVREVSGLNLDDEGECFLAQLSLAMLGHAPYDSCEPTK